MRGAAAELALGAGLLKRLPSFLRHPLGPAEARSALKRRLRERETRFLELAREAIYADTRSPYRRLLALAGCEYGDLVRLVEGDGLEAALAELLRSGVFLSVDEFKGRRPAIRNGETVEAGPNLLRNPLATFHVAARSSGSRGPATPVLFDLAFIRDCAGDTCLFLDARGGSEWRTAIWEVPGGGATFRILKYAAFGSPPERWFSPVHLAAPGLHPRYRWSARALRLVSTLARTPLPAPEHAPLSDPIPVARWMQDVLRSGETPHLFTLASPAVRLCQAARDAGIDLRGATMTIGGEPVTAARLGEVRATGAEAAPRYGSIECGPLGYACLRPQDPDEVHLLADLHALVQAGAEGAARGFPARALFVTSLLPTAPFVLLNVSMGDQAEVSRRACGCPLERLGWTTHLREIRSYEKLTSAGMTFLDTDVVRVLEEVLPERFGGKPTHYQLLEEEGEGGAPRLRLLVHPAVGTLDETALADAFFAALGTGSGGERIMVGLWRDAGLLRVERRAPVATASGKIHHLIPRGSLRS